MYTKHNELRQRIATGNVENQPFATNMEQLLYDSALESIALKHALQCNFTYNPSLNVDATNLKDNLSFTLSDRYPFGENIAYDVSGPALTADKLQDIIEEQWFAGHQYYDYHSSTCHSYSHSGTLDECKSYEKLAWATTRYMACGVSICPSLSLPDGNSISPAAFIVCDYWPSFDAQHLSIYDTNPDVNSPEDIGDSLCSECPSDRRDECLDGLCGGCGSSRYHFCQNRLDDAICDGLKDDCDTDVVVHISCTQTCQCEPSDFIPDTECDSLYISPTSPSTTAVQEIPDNNSCIYKGWYDVTNIENGADIQCPDGYTLPNIHTIPFVEDHCLKDGDSEMLDHRLPVLGIAPYGIAIGDVQYGVGCDWNSDYVDGVIPTHSGIKCGDGEQLFICISDTVPTRAPTSAPTAGPTFAPTDAPTEGPTAGPTSAPTSGPTAGPSHSPIPNTMTPVNTTYDVDLPSTTESEKLEPFRMWLIFPNFGNGLHSENTGGAVTPRELLSMEMDPTINATGSNEMMALYPSRGISISRPIDKRNLYGYRFNVTRNFVDSKPMSLSRIEYAIDAEDCNLIENVVNGVRLRLLKREDDPYILDERDQWREIEHIDYSVQWNGKVVRIDVKDVVLNFDVQYVAVIDTSILMDRCQKVTHLIHAKTLAHTDFVGDMYTLKGLQSVIVKGDGGFEIRRDKYWTEMSIVLE